MPVIGNSDLEAISSASEILDWLKFHVPSVNTKPVWTHACMEAPRHQSQSSQSF